MGAYGEVERETGEFRINGSIYDREFQSELDRLGLHLRVADYPPRDGPVEQDFYFAPKGVKQVNLRLGVYVSS